MTSSFYFSNLLVFRDIFDKDSDLLLSFILSSFIWSVHGLAMDSGTHGTLITLYYSHSIKVDRVCPEK